MAVDGIHFKLVVGNMTRVGLVRQHPFIQVTYQRLFYLSTPHTMPPARTALITGSTDHSGIGFTAGLLLANTGAFSKILLSVGYHPYCQQDAS